MDRVKEIKEIKLDDGCDHHICQCLMKAIENEVVPGVYEDGYDDGVHSIVGALEDILTSAHESVKMGIDRKKWVEKMTMTLTRAAGATPRPSRTVDMGGPVN
jgi:hypothetical protein